MRSTSARCSAESIVIAVGSLKPATRLRSCAIARPIHTIAAVSLAVPAFTRTSLHQLTASANETTADLRLVVARDDVAERGSNFAARWIFAYDATIARA